METKDVASSPASQALGQRHHVPGVDLPPELPSHHLQDNGGGPSV